MGAAQRKLRGEGRHGPPGLAPYRAENAQGAGVFSCPILPPTDQDGRSARSPIQEPCAPPQPGRRGFCDPSACSGLCRKGAGDNARRLPAGARERQNGSGAAQRRLCHDRTACVDPIGRDAVRSARASGRIKPSPACRGDPSKLHWPTAAAMRARPTRRARGRASSGNDPAPASHPRRCERGKRGTGCARYLMM